VDEEFLRTVGKDRISSRQIDELIGLSRGLIADGEVNQAEAEFLQKWLAANLTASDQPLIRELFRRVSEFLKDGVLDDEERSSLFDTLNSFVAGDFELGEVLKSTTLPLCAPAPSLSFKNIRYCFTGTFLFGQRKDCEAAVVQRGAVAGGLTQKTQILVIGSYATESWKHSSFGNKIMQAVEWRASGLPISIISEAHWRSHL